LLDPKKRRPLAPEHERTPLSGWVPALPSEVTQTVFPERGTVAVYATHQAISAPLIHKSFIDKGFPGNAPTWQSSLMHRSSASPRDPRTRSAQCASRPDGDGCVRCTCSRFFTQPKKWQIRRRRRRLYPVAMPAHAAREGHLPARPATLERQIGSGPGDAARWPARGRGPSIDIAHVAFVVSERADIVVAATALMPPWPHTTSLSATSTSFVMRLASPHK
jgi:hypothetical protein